MTHDTGEMEDYADDIDTLLVFVSTIQLQLDTASILSSPLTQQAGLFSAILTAFLVQTYPMLQADGTDTTNQLLALSVSTQLRTAGTIISDTLNQTLSTLVDAVSTSFSPSTATRWINILFFLALVFSLAAALFSILAKQWIREYIKWNSPLALPRENVLVRQIRIEAWEDWQVSTILSSIPILLELGMILFLAGVIILLWTLDDIVAITVTVFVSLFLGAFAAFTVMPILYKRCPYRSPTAWACYIASHFLVSSIQYFVRLTGGCRRSLKDAWDLWKRRSSNSLLQRVQLLIAQRAEWWHPLAQWPGRLQTWRDCDLGSRNVTKVRAGRWWPKAIDLHHTAGIELARESIGLWEDGTLPEGPESAGHYVAHAFLLNLVEVSYLVRALAWVHQSSQSTQVVAYIDQCMHQLLRVTTRVRDRAESIHMVTIWCVLLSLVKDRARSPHLALVAGSDNNQGDISQLRRAASGHTRFPSLSVPPSLGHIFPILIRLFAQFAMQQATDPLNASPRSVRRCEELLRVLQSTVSQNFMFSLDGTWYLDALTTIRRVYGSHDDAIRLMTFEQLLEHGMVTVGPDQKLCEAYATLYLPLECSLITNLSAFSQGSMRRDDYKSLLLHYFSKFDNASDEYLNMFIITSVCYLRYRDPPSTTTSTILEKMISVAEIISHRLRRGTHRVNNAEDEAWINRLYWLRDELSGENYAELFRRLLHTFERSYACDVLAGDQNVIKRELHGCLEAAHKERICEVTNCPWVSHSSECRYISCTFLRGITAAAVPRSEHEVLSAAPAPDAARTTSPDPAPIAHELLTAHPHPEHSVLHPSSVMRVHSDAPVDGLSSGGPSNGSFLGHSAAILAGESASIPGATIRPFDNVQGTVHVETTSCVDITGGISNVYTAPPGADDPPRSSERVASMDPTDDSPNACSASLENRDTGRTVAEDLARHYIPPQAHMLDRDGDSTDSASARTLTVGTQGSSDANAVLPGTDTTANHHMQPDMPHDFPLRLVVAVGGPPRAERATGARSGEGSPVRTAAVLFQGEAGVSVGGGEMFELTRRDEGAGEGGHGGAEMD